MSCLVFVLPLSYLFQLKNMKKSLLLSFWVVGGIRISGRQSLHSAELWLPAAIENPFRFTAWPITAPLPQTLYGCGGWDMVRHARLSRSLPQLREYRFHGVVRGRGTGYPGRERSTWKPLGWKAERTACTLFNGSFSAGQDQGLQPPCFFAQGINQMKIMCYVMHPF